MAERQLPSNWGCGRWKPGQSGNPKGRPPRKTLTEAIYQVLQEQAPERLGNGTWMEILALSIVKNAAAGKFPFMKEIIDRIDGKQVETLAGQNVTVQQIFMAISRYEEGRALLGDRAIPFDNEGNYIPKAEVEKLEEGGSSATGESVEPGGVGEPKS